MPIMRRARRVPIAMRIPFTVSEPHRCPGKIYQNAGRREGKVFLPAPRTPVTLSAEKC
jgi:hypothetical protein